MMELIQTVGTDFSQLVSGGTFLCPFEMGNHQVKSAIMLLLAFMHEIMKKNQKSLETNMSCDTSYLHVWCIIVSMIHHIMFIVQ